MPLYEITVHKNPADYVTFWKEKNNIKAAYEYGVEEGINIFGAAPYSVVVAEDKPTEV